MKDRLEMLMPLPPWARAYAQAAFSDHFMVHILSLQFPRWDDCFLPLYLNQNQQLIFEMPESLPAAIKQGRIWRSCPEQIYFSASTQEIIVESSRDSDHPRPAIAERQLISPPDFKALTIESLTSSFENYTGDHVPRLSPKSSDFQPVKVIRIK